MSFYNNRPSYVKASWRTRRLVEVEPNFDNTIEISGLISTTIELSQPIPPPPMYYRGQSRINPTELEGAQQNLARSFYPTSANTITSIKSLSASILHWDYHPGFISTWNRPKILWKCLIGHGRYGRGERLSKEWPKEFSGSIWRRDIEGVEIGITEDPRRDSGFASDDEHYNPARYSTSSSRRLSNAISLAPTNNSTNTTSLPIHPNSIEFLNKITLLNNAINQALIKTRVILSFLEIIGWVIVVLLITSIAVEKGNQGIFIEAVEVCIVLLIIGSAIGIGVVRMNRFALSRTLRSLSRDWNPLPISTNSAQGFGNYLSPDPLPSAIPQPDPASPEERARKKKEAEEASKPKLRWNMRATEGYYYLSYRPIIRVELFTPSSFVPFRSPSTSNTTGVGLERVASNTSSSGPARRRNSTRVPVPMIDMSLEEIDGSNRVEESVGAIVPPYSPV